VGFLKKLRIVPANTSFIYSTSGPDGREINTLTKSQDRFATALGGQPLTNKDWYDPEGNLATFVEDLHYGKRDVPRSISQSGIFVAVPEVITQTSRFGDKLCWAAMLDVDCHGFESQVDWDEIRQNGVELNERFGLEYIWNRSRGGGLHIWYLFKEAVELRASVKFLDNVRKKLLAHSLFEFRGITPEIRKAFRVDVRPSPGSADGQNQRIAMPNGFVYKNPQFGMADIQGQIALTDREIEAKIGPDAVLSWQSPTRIAKTNKVKDREEQEITASGTEWLKAFLDARRATRAFTKPEWSENNKWPGTPTDVIVARVRSDDYFKDFYEEIGEVMPCILARISEGPMLEHEWADMIFNVSLSCLAIIGFEEEDDQERALDLVTLIMNHPMLDWLSRPQDKEYYRKTGSFKGALKHIRSGGGKPPSCQRIDAMKEHCRSAHCAMCSGGYSDIVKKGGSSQEARSKPPYLFKRVYITDPFEPVERRVRYISEEFLVDETFQKKDMMFRLNDGEALDPNRFILAIQDRTPRCYDFSEMIEFCESQMQNKKVWGVFWTRVIRDPAEEVVEHLLHGPRFLGKIAAEIKDLRFQVYGQTEQLMMAGSDAEATVWLYIHQSLVIKVTRKIVMELKVTADEIECSRVYMQKLLGAEGEGAHWKIKMKVAENNSLLAPGHYINIQNVLIERPSPPTRGDAPPRGDVLPSELHRIGDKDLLH
jgi:hypothetical protein